jgi:hypothetical protein
MEKTIKSALLILCLMILATKAHAQGIYDGIYSTTPNIGYVYVREQNGSIVAVLNLTYNNQLIWHAFQGPLIGATVQLSSIIGYTSVTISATFTSTASFNATQKSCASNNCIFPNGTTFTGLKIW